MRKLKNSIRPYYNIIKIIWRSLKWFNSINWHKTIYFNFRMLPIHEAKNLPIIFYGKINIVSLTGKLILDTPLKFGIVKFGENLEMLRRNFKKAEIRIDGTFCIKGSFSTGNDYLICVLKNSYLEIGEGSYLGNFTKIIATNYIKIGKGFRFGFDSQISDSNYHYTVDLESKKVARFNGKIIIGDYCWVGNRSSIMKGTTTPCNLIIASYSILNKDYTITVPENSLIAGQPAKLIRKNMIRVFDPHLEIELSKYFRENPKEEYYFLKKGDNYIPNT